MKSLKLRSLHFFSYRERAARSVAFHPKLTVVLGENDTGKSCLLKSIYAALGADAARTSESWKSAQPDLLLEFRLDDDDYTILRAGKTFALFDSVGNKLWQETSIVSGLGPKIAELFNFGLRLQNRQGVSAIPPPAFSLLPFYVDQDVGWQKAWSSFAQLSMHSNFRQDVAYFHAGLRPNEYYEAKTQVASAEYKRTELKGERAALERAAARLQSGRTALKFDLQPGLFGEKLDELLQRCEALQRKQENIQRRLSALYSQRAELLEQVAIVEAASNELELDTSFLREKVDFEIICPTCGNVHVNDFANKFALISDADACRAFLIELKLPLGSIEAQIAEVRAELESHTRDISDIQKLLEEKRGDIKLRDLVEGESERLLDATISDQRQQLDAQIGAQDIAADTARETMKSFQDKSREAAINGFYSSTMKNFLQKLDVTTPSDESYRRVDLSVQETGSDMPRALLAQYYSFLHTLRKYSTALVAPIVIDTPIQQDQDPINANRMIEFAINNVPSDMQLVLGTVSLHNVPFAGTRIETSVKYHLLLKAEFEKVRAKISPFLQQLLSD